MPYDLFISYSRRDNASGRITELKNRNEADYRAFAKEDLRCFFDLEDIRRAAALFLGSGGFAESMKAEG